MRSLQIVVAQDRFEGAQPDEAVTDEGLARLLDLRAPYYQAVINELNPRCAMQRKWLPVDCPLPSTLSAMGCLCIKFHRQKHHNTAVGNFRQAPVKVAEETHGGYLSHHRDTKRAPARCRG